MEKSILEGLIISILFGVIIFLFIIYNYLKTRNIKYYNQPINKMYQQHFHYQKDGTPPKNLKKFGFVFETNANDNIHSDKKYTNKVLFKNNWLVGVSIIEIIISLILIVYPELQYVVLDGLDKPQYLNPFYQRALASSIISINIIFLVYVLRQKSEDQNIMDESHENEFFIINNFKLQNNSKTLTEFKKNYNELTIDYFILGLVILPLKTLYYGILTFCGFVLQFIETIISNYFWNTNLSSSRSTIIMIIFFIISLGLFITHLVITLNINKKLLEKQIKVKN
jgi:hypothetical protein